jgi:outer membrane protein assembly factor BamA
MRSWPGIVLLAVMVAIAWPASVPAGTLRDDVAPEDGATGPFDATVSDPGPERPRSGWLFVLPALSYSPETKFAFGASASRYYLLDEDPRTRPSTVLPLVLLTTAGQVIVGVYGDVWWDANRWHLTANLGFRRFPTQFYGVGDDTPADAEEDYTPRTTNLGLELKRRVASALYVGVIADLTDVAIVEREAGGLLESGAVTGADGGLLVGTGASVSWDSRDGVLYPRGGSWHRLAVVRYLDVLGGDHVYTTTSLSLARYWSLGADRVLAARLSGEFVGGGRAPFYRLHRLSLRGYFEERYRENHAVRVQVEYRTGVTGRLGAAVFLGAGELASRLDGLRLDEALPVAGAGLRFAVGGEQRANLRLDVGFGDGDSGVYISFGEAF